VRRESEKAAEEARIAKDALYRADEVRIMRDALYRAKEANIVRNEEFHRSSDLFVEQLQAQVMAFSDDLL
jgi:hypothetical protein